MYLRYVNAAIAIRKKELINHGDTAYLLLFGQIYAGVLFIVQ